MRRERYTPELRRRLMGLLQYDPETGSLRWVSSGSAAGCLRPDGYLVVRVDGSLFMAHRLIWLMVTGQAPPTCVDHLNHVKSDNRWSNLRASDKVHNGQNRRGAQANHRSTGCRNVYFLGRGNLRWLVQIKHPGGILRKCFDNLLDAACFAASSRIRLHAGSPFSRPS